MLVESDDDEIPREKGLMLIAIHGVGRQDSREAAPF
jgi:hypothetical protein